MTGNPIDHNPGVLRQVLRGKISNRVWRRLSIALNILLEEIGVFDVVVVRIDAVRDAS